MSDFLDFNEDDANDLKLLDSSAPEDKPSYEKYRNMTGSQILDDIIKKEQDNPKFKRKEARVSAVGLCQRRAVAGALGLLEVNIPFEYIECGFMAQSRALLRYKTEFPLVEEEVSVQTAIPGVMTHPDILIPEISKCIQVKTTGDKNFVKKGGPGIKDHYEAQILLEWKSWQNSKFCITETGQRIDIVPQQYELMYLGRETYGKYRQSYPIRWDPIKARTLEEKLIETQNYIIEGSAHMEENKSLKREDYFTLSGVLPEKPFKSLNWECGREGSPIALCPLYESCWGKKEEKKSLRSISRERPDDSEDKWWER